MSKAPAHPLISQENCKKLADLQTITEIGDVNLLIRDALAVYASAYGAIAEGQGFGIIDMNAGWMQLYDTPTMDSAHKIAKAKAVREEKFRNNVANDTIPSGGDMTKMQMESLIPEAKTEPMGT